MSKVRVAILGCGGMAGAHAERFRSHPDVDIVALCDVSEEVVRKFIERNLKEYAGKPQIFTDPAKMYAEAKPQAVAIITPHTMHFEHGSQALAAGCHVLMEKPMVTAAADAHKLAALAKASGKVFVVGYNSPFTPEFAFAREAIRTSAYGKLELINGFLVQGWMKGTTGTWRQKPELSGGGQAYDSGAHLLNSLCWSVESDIAEVFAFVDNHGTPVDINSVINIRFANGVLANITVGGNCPASGCALNYFFDNGRIEIDGWGGSWINVFNGRDKVKYPAISGASQTPNDNFIDAVIGRAQPRTSPINGIIQSELMDAIYESARTGKPAKPKRVEAKG
ncbi:MAG: Gfo/Idh/MocA family oxidoreductase [Planctomycetes bacterium]|nr:Gfo/Idh/MocA family oxidoreductase [Planctomycetota bacterium]